MLNRDAAVEGFVKEVLEHEGLKYRFEEDRGRFRVDFNGVGMLGSIELMIYARKHQVMVYGCSPIWGRKNDPKSMAELGEFLHRANYGMPHGCFEMDFNDGEIRYKCDIMFEELPGEALALTCIAGALKAYEEYGPGIAGIIFGGRRADEMIGECENGDEEDGESEAAEDEEAPRRASGREDAGMDLAALEGEIESLFRQLLADSGLLTGPGGSGKEGETDGNGDAPSR